MPRKLVWRTTTCWACRRVFEYRAGYMPGTCGRKACILGARKKSLRMAQRARRQQGKPVYTGRNNETPPQIDLDTFRPEGSTLHVCGSMLVFGTDLDGYGIEWCGKCGVEMLIPRWVA